MANLESSFRSQILCGKYFNLPYASQEIIGLCVHYVYTHAVSQFVVNDFLNVQCVLSGRKGKMPQQGPSAAAKLPASKRKHLLNSREKKISVVFDLYGCEEMECFLLHQLDRLDHSLQRSLCNAQLRKDCQGGGLKGLKIGSRVAVCLLSFDWNNPRHNRLIPNRK